MRMMCHSLRSSCQNGHAREWPTAFSMQNAHGNSTLICAVQCTADAVHCAMHHPGRTLSACTVDSARLSSARRPGDLPFNLHCDHRYCGCHDPASVVKCITTGKWFCNGRIGASGSCAIVHLVKSKLKEVQLHKGSPLGDAVLECYASGTRNVFTLGFVPVQEGNTVALLARDTPPNAPAVKDLQVDMSQVSGCCGAVCDNGYQKTSHGLLCCLGGGMRMHIIVLLIVQPTLHACVRHHVSLQL